MTQAAVGFDVASTYSGVAIWCQGDKKPSIVDQNVDGPADPRLQSVLVFDPDSNDYLTGRDAVVAGEEEQWPVVEKWKRDMGRLWTDTAYAKMLEEDTRGLKPIPNPDWHQLCQYVYQVDRTTADGKRVKQLLTPMHMAACVVARLMQTARSAASNGASIKTACYAVPARFSDPQQQATEAAVRAGMMLAGAVDTTVHVITEPEAAALQYLLDKHGATGRKDAPLELVLVVDLGGSTSDVSLMLVDARDNSVTSLANMGNDLLGGGDVTTALVAQFAEQHGLESLDEADRARLHKKVEEMKTKSIWTKADSKGRVKLSGGTVHLQLAFDKADAEVADVFAALRPLIDGTVTAGLAKVEQMIDELDREGSGDEGAASQADDLRELMKTPTVVPYMVGGCAVVPSLQHMVYTSIPGTHKLQPVVSKNPYTAVADGCAIHAAVKAGFVGAQLNQCTTRGLAMEIFHDARDGKGRQKMLVQLIEPGTPSSKASALYVCREAAERLEDLRGSFAINVYQPLTQDPRHPLLTTRACDLSFQHPFENKTLDPRNVPLSEALDHFVKIGSWKIPSHPGVVLPAPGVYSDPPKAPLVAVMFRIDENGTVCMSGQVLPTVKFSGEMRFSGRVEGSDHVKQELARAIVEELRDAGTYIKYAEVVRRANRAELTKAATATADESDDDSSDDDQHGDDETPPTKRVRFVDPPTV